MCIFCAFDGRPVRGRAGREHNGVWCQLLDQGLINTGIQSNLDPDAFDLAREICYQTTKFGATGQQLCQQHLTTELTTCLTEHDPMPSLGGHGGSFQTGRTAADHEHALAGLARRRRLGIIQLTAGLRVLDAGNPDTQKEVAHTSLIAGNTSSNVIDVATRGLCRHLRVAD